MRLKKIFTLLYGPEEDTFVGMCLGVCKHVNHMQTLKVTKGFRVFTYRPAWPFNLPCVDQIFRVLQQRFKGNLTGNLAVNVSLQYY